MSATLPEALGYIARGWRVFPTHAVRTQGACTCGRRDCSSPAKHPITTHGLIDATTDEQIVSGWWRQRPWANIAVATGQESGIVVLDVDTAKGGETSLALLEAEVDGLRDTLTSRTGGGGLHLVFAHPGEGVKVKTRARAFGDGLDVRGDGGYIIAPPSQHISGQRYAWVDANAALAPFPSELLRRLEARRVEIPQTVVPFRRPGTSGTPYGAAALERLVEELQGAPEGVRNETLNAVAWSAARLVAGGELDQGATFEVLEQVAQQIGLEPLEVKRTIKSAADAGLTNPKSAPPRPAPASFGLTSHHTEPAADTTEQPEAPEDPAKELDDFLSEDEPDYDWLIDGLLERGDRTILTGPEGGGKSTLLRQLAVQGGSGLHPFTLEPIKAIRVLYVDLENSRNHVKREFRRVRIAAAGRYEKGNVHIVVAPQGMDLFGHPPDGKWLEERIQYAGPTLLIIGPLYKLAAGDPTSEEVARRVSYVLDDLRTRYQFALIIEAHTPHAAGGGRRPERPYGASMWLRWPEFGLHLSPSGALTHWRGDRDEREWPTVLKRGGSWPWTMTTDPRDALWHRILTVVEQYGRTPSVRQLAHDLSVSKSSVDRAIQAHHDEWNGYRKSLGDVPDDH